MVVGIIRNMLCDFYFLFFSLDLSSLQSMKTTQWATIEHTELRTFQDPGEFQIEKKGRNANLLLPLTD
jgi:hypothetical protein